MPRSASIAAIAVTFVACSSSNPSTKSTGSASQPEAALEGDPTATYGLRSGGEEELGNDIDARMNAALQSGDATFEPAAPPEDYAKPKGDAGYIPSLQKCWAVADCVGGRRVACYTYGASCEAAYWDGRGVACYGAYRGQWGTFTNVCP